MRPMPRSAPNGMRRVTSESKGQAHENPTEDFADGNRCRCRLDARFPRSVGATRSTAAHAGANQADRGKPRSQRRRSHQRSAAQAGADAGLHRHSSRHHRARSQRGRRLHHRVAGPGDRTVGHRLRPEPAARSQPGAHAPGRPRGQQQSDRHARRGARRRRRPARRARRPSPWPTATARSEAPASRPRRSPPSSGRSKTPVPPELRGASIS